jgi:hypothetical protein
MSSSGDHDINLNIRSTYQDSASISTVTGQVKALTDALRSQAEASRTGDVTAAQLNKTQNDAALAAKRLIEARSALLALQQRENDVAEQSTRLAEARANRERIAASIPAPGGSTPRQQADLATARSAITELSALETRTKAEESRLQRAMEATARLSALPPGRTAAQEKELAGAETAVTKLERANASLIRTYDRAAAAVTGMGVDLFETSKALGEVTRATQELGAAQAHAAQAGSAIFENQRKSADAVKLYTELFRQQEREEAEAASARMRRAAEETAAEERASREKQARMEREAAAVADVRARAAEGERRVGGYTGGGTMATQYAAMYQTLLEERDQVKKLADEQAKVQGAIDEFRNVAREGVQRSLAAANIRPPTPGPTAATTASRVQGVLGGETAESTAQLEARISTLAGTMTRAGRTVKEYTGDLRAMRDATQELERQAGAVDNFDKMARQISSLERQRAAGNSSLLGLQDRADRAKTPDEAASIASEVQRQASANAGTDQQLQRARLAIIPLREELTRLGIAENETAAATRRLVAAAGVSRSALDEAARRQVDSVQKLATDAQSRSAATLAAARASTPASTPLNGVQSGGAGSASDQIGAILQGPGGLPSRSKDDVDDVTTALSRLQAMIEKGKLSIHDYNDFMDRAAAIGQKIASNGALIDKFNQQRVAVQQANLELSRMDEALLATTSAQDKATDPAFAANVARDEAAVAKAAQALIKEREALQALGTALTRAGVDTQDMVAETGKLAAASTKLVQITQKGEGSTNALFGLSPQKLKFLEDDIGQFVTQVSLGQGVLRAFESQFNQILELFGTGIGAIKSWGLYLAAPIAALVAFSVALARFREDSSAIREFNALLIGTADGSRTTSEAMIEATRSIRDMGASFSDANVAVEAFYKAGIRPELFETFGRMAQDLVDAYGTKFPDAVKEVTSAFTGNFDAIKALDEQYHFLNNSTYEAIRAKFDEGKGIEAVQIAQEAFKRQQDEAAAANRNDWQVEIRSLTKAWNDFIDSLVNLVPFDRLVNKLRDVTHTMEDLKNLVAGKIDLNSFFSSQGDIYSGGPHKTLEEQQIAQLEKERDSIKGELANPGAKSTALPDGGAYFTPGLTDKDIADKENRLGQIAAKLVELRQDIASSGLEAQADALAKRIAELRDQSKDLDAKQPRSGYVRTGGDAGKNAPEGYAGMRDSVAAQVGVDPVLFGRLQRVESVFDENGNPKDSPTGPKGALQLAQATFDEMKALHGDIIKGGIRDPLSNTQAGAFYLKQQTEAANNDAHEGVRRYHDGPDPARRSDAGVAEADKVTGGYGGSALLPNNLPEALAAYQRIQAQRGLPADPTVLGNAASGGAASTGKGQTDPATAVILNRQSAAIEQIQRGTNELRDRSLRGNTPENVQQDETRINQQLLDIIRGLKDTYVPGANPKLDTALADRRAELEKVAADRRDRAQTEIDQKAQEERQKVIDAISRLVESNDKTDKTDPVAARAAVEEERKRGQAQFDTARKNGIGNINGQTIDQAQATFNAGFDTKSQAATTAADEAALDKTVADRKTQMDAILASAKAGTLTITELFARTNATAQSFVEKINAAKAAALGDERGQKQTPEVQASESKIDAVDVTSAPPQMAAIKLAMTQLTALQKTRTDVEQQQKTLLAENATTAGAAENAIAASFKATAQQSKDLIASIQTQLNLMLQMKTITPEVYGQLTAQLKLAEAETNHLSAFQLALSKTIEDSFTSNAMRGFDTIAAAIGKVITAHGKLKDVIQAVGIAFTQFAAGFLKDVATMIIKTYLLAYVKSLIGTETGGGSGIFSGLISAAGSGPGGGATAAAPSSLNHGGTGMGVIGPGASNMRRSVDPSVFIGAPRYHDGVDLGLASDEHAAILQDGEKVMSASDVRASAANGAKAATSGGTRQVLAMGDKEIANAMAGSHGEQVVLTHLKRNTPTVRNIAGR